MFTGVHGALQYAGVTIGYAEANVKITRNVIEAKRGGKRSNIQAPGKFSITGSITRYMLDGSKLADLITDTPVTGTSQTLVNAGASLNTAGIMSQSGTNAGNAKVRVTTAGATTTTQTVLTFYGTDPAGNIAQDYIVIPAGTPINTTFDTSKVFATVTRIDNTVAAGSGVTCGIASVAGVTTAVVSVPKYFTLIFSVTKGSSNVVYTLPRCFLTSGEFSLGDADTPVQDKLDFAVEDADNATLSYA